jgi:gas vesicle protein
MGAGKRIVSFGGGGLVGFLIGAGIAKLAAAQRGDDLRAALAARVEAVKAAGDAAQAATEQRLIARFRGDVEDPNALEQESRQAAELQAQASAALAAGAAASPAAATVQATSAAPRRGPS